MVATVPAAARGRRSRQLHVSGNRANRTRTVIGTPVGNSLAPHNPLGMQYSHDVGQPAGYTTSAEPLSWSNVGDIWVHALPAGPPRRGR